MTKRKYLNDNPAAPAMPQMQARGSMESARERLRRRRGEILAETAAGLLAGRDPDREVMPQLFRALTAEHIVDATLGFMVTDLDEGMKLAFAEGFDKALVQRCLTLDFGQAICGMVASTGRPMHVADIQNTLDPIADLVRAAGINAYACEPLMVSDRLLGTISFASKERKRFDIEDLLFFRSIAKHVALARDRARNKIGKRRRPKAKSRISGLI